MPWILVQEPSTTTKCAIFALCLLTASITWTLARWRYYVPEPQPKESINLWKVAFIVTVLVITVVHIYIHWLKAGQYRSSNAVYDQRDEFYHTLRPQAKARAGPIARGKAAMGK